jgi:hypothetical protein
MPGQRPERKRIGLHLVKRLTLVAAVLTVAALVVPTILARIGLWGPNFSERLSEAERAVGTARHYGARDETPDLAAALGELEQARGLRKAGKDRQARLAASRALDHAIRAQRQALLGRETARRRAAGIVKDLDRGVEDLEKLYSERAPGLDRKTTSRLFSQMKDARQAAATLVLAYQKGGYDEVIAGEALAKQVLASTAEQLRAAGS